jgi:hypothetical protein
MLGAAATLDSQFPIQFPPQPNTTPQKQPKIARGEMGEMVYISHQTL